MHKKIIALEILIIIFLVWTLVPENLLRKNNVINTIDNDEEITVTLAEPTYTYVGDPSVDSRPDNPFRNPSIETTESFLYNTISNPKATTTPSRYGAKGYYMTHNTCSVFKLTGASKEIFNISKKDPTLGYIININPNQLEGNGRNLLLNSSSTNPIFIQTTFDLPARKPTHECESVVNIVSIIEISPSQ